MAPLRVVCAGRIDWRGMLGLVLIAYATFIYAALGYLLGHARPNSPVFAVAPCPTTIFTFCVLLLAGGPLPVWLVATPVVWAGIGAMAAVSLNVPEDLGLLVCGVLGAALLPFGVHGGRIVLLRKLAPSYFRGPVATLVRTRAVSRADRAERPLSRAHAHQSLTAIHDPKR
jgi:phosphotransferase system  glucose/maltose/N-acetylglucosamine-specific IIC component